MASKKRSEKRKSDEKEDLQGGKNIHMASKKQSSTAAGAPGPSGPPTEPREVYLESERYFMAVALLSAQRSRDPNTQVGACVVNQEKKVVGVGYNKMPNGCEGQLPWARVDPDNDKLKTKYVYVCHAELNAIVDSNRADLKGCSIYVTLFPCNECAKLIIQNGITEVIYLSDKYRDTPETQASKRMLSLAGVQTRDFMDMPTGNKIEIDFTPMQ